MGKNKASVGVGEVGGVDTVEILDKVVRVSHWKSGI